MSTAVAPVVSSTIAMAPETSSPEISALSRGLLYSPERIFEYVVNNIAYEHYYGSKKGARLALLEGSGNDYDQCALLIALLKEAAANTTGGANWTIVYEKGSQVVPYGDGTGNDFVSWVGTAPQLYSGMSWANAWSALGYSTDPFANDPVLNAWPDDAKKKYLLISDFSLQRDWPMSAISYNAAKALVLERIWVKLVRDGATYLLDPSFKRGVRAPPFASLASAMTYTRADFIAGAGVTAGSNECPNSYEVIGIHEDVIRDKLSDYAYYLAAALKGGVTTPNLSVDDFLGRLKIVPVEIGSTLPMATPLGTVGTVSDFAAIQDEMRVKLTIELGLSTNYHVSTTIPVADLAGQRLSLTFSGTTVQLWQEDTVLLTTVTSDPSVRLDTTFSYPNNYISDTTTTDTKGHLYSRNDAYAYAIVYGFTPNSLQLRQRQGILDGYLRSARALTGVTYDAAGNLNLSSISDAILKRQCITETLNVMGLSWLYHTRLSDRLVGEQFHADMMAHHSLGRVAQEGVCYIDVYQKYSGCYSLLGSNIEKEQAFHLSGFFDSAHEHGIIEEMQPSGVGAISTVKVLSIANNHNGLSTEICFVNDHSWNGEDLKSDFKSGGYPDSDLTAISNGVAAGYEYLIPIYHEFSLGTWKGLGYVIMSPTYIGMMVNTEDPLNGGYNTWTGSLTSLTAANGQSAPGAKVAGKGVAQPVSTHPTINTLKLTSPEPVDMSTGAYLQENEDLSLGETEPRGLHLVRRYNSNSINFDPAGLGWGWTHSYNINAALRSAPDAGMGESTPYDLAAYLSAVYVAADIVKSASGYPARDWALTALIANSAVNNLKNNAVSITMGMESMQFIKQPDNSSRLGLYQPPAMSSLSLTKDATGNYSLKERFGRTFLFSAAKGLRCTSITDFDGKTMGLDYDAANNNRLYHVTDASSPSRKLTFNYTGSRLSSVSDSSRSATYLADDGNGNLTGYTDPENKTWHYTYLDRLITQTKNPDDAVVIENDYDSQNRVKTQRNQGLQERSWSFFWSGVRNVERSPLSQQTTYFYDRCGRSLGVMDGDGNRSRLAYDGQDHIVQFTSPKNEAVNYLYDNNQDLVQSTDPAGAVVKWTYCQATQDTTTQRLTQIDQIDAAIPPALAVPTRTTKYVYNQGNASNRPDSIIDPRNVTVGIVYYSSGAAVGKPWKVTLNSTEGNRLTTYYYDVSYGLLQKVETPNSAGTGVYSEQYVFDPYGDLQTYTDKRGFQFGFLYNNRRQIWQVTGPGDGADYANAVTKFRYNSSGDLAYVVDPMSHTTHFTYSPTHMLLTVQRGLLAQGEGDYDATQAVTTLTNHYDVRDWLHDSKGPFNDQTTGYTYYDSGRVKTVTNPEGYVVTYGYDGDGQQNSVADNPDGEHPRTIQENSNVRGQLGTISDPVNPALTVASSYDAWGDMLSITDRLTHTYKFGYELNGLPNLQKTPLLHSTTLTYNDRNLPWKMVKPTQQNTGNNTTYQYDAADQLQQLTDPLGMITYSHDANGNFLTAADGAATISRTYDPYNRLKTYTSGRGDNVTYHYYANGLLKSVTYPFPANRAVTYTYDRLNRLYQVSDWAGRTTTFSWRSDGLLFQILRPNWSTRTLTFDRAGNFKTIEERDPSGTIQTLLSYQLEAGGRIHSVAQFPLPQGTPSSLAAMTYDADNRLLTFAGTTCNFDDDGNMTHGPLGNGGDNNGTGFGDYTFDVRNRLTASFGQTRFYDADNYLFSQRIGGPAPTYFDYDGAVFPSLLVREPPPNSAIYFYVYGAGQLLYEVSEGGASPTGVLYYQFDNNGNTIALNNNEGQVVQRNEYTPYGQLTRRSANYDTPFLFAGAFGALTGSDGLISMRARIYNPRIGRFLNADPIGFGGGMNWYTYANNDPISKRDPLGLDDNMAGFGGMVGFNTYQEAIGYARVKRIQDNPLHDALLIVDKLPTLQRAHRGIGGGLTATGGVLSVVGGLGLMYGTGGWAVVGGYALCLDGAYSVGAGTKMIAEAWAGPGPYSNTPGGVVELIAAQSGNSLTQTGGAVGDLGIAIATPPECSGRVGLIGFLWGFVGRGWSDIDAAALRRDLERQILHAAGESSGPGK